MMPDDGSCLRRGIVRRTMDAALRDLRPTGAAGDRLRREAELRRGCVAVPPGEMKRQAELRRD